MNKHLYIKILEFGEKHIEGFNYTEIKSAIKPSDWEGVILVRNLEAAFNNFKNSGRIHMGSYTYKPSLFECVDLAKKEEDEKNYYSPGTRYIINGEAYFNYLDYLELQIARKSSEDANKYSRKSIKIATWALLIGIISSIAQILIEIYNYIKIS